MRELERIAADTPLAQPVAAGVSSIGIVGRGRVGRVLTTALTDAGFETGEPAGRDEIPAGDAILLCVPDAEIPAAAHAVAGAAPFVGHTSGATPLRALEPAGVQAFGLHPLQTITGSGVDLHGCGCAIAGSTFEALELAREIALRLGMEPIEIADADRPAYHAAASISSNFLVTLEAAAETVAGGAGIEPDEARRLLGPLVRTTVENWMELGPERALTGPVARGDDATVASQRAAVAGTAPELLELFDALVRHTREVAAA
jgi:predicted short-subunit dehydrogenase-like oxidoreductase (DUF2520 family)